jgi:rubrerythrin
MAQVFNASEVFDIGVQIEKNGKEFYLAAEKRSNDPFLKTMFSQLAAWEGNHVELFEQLRASLPSTAESQLEYDPDNMIHLYLKAVADNKLYINQDYAIDSCKTSLDVLKKALDFEKESVVIYSSMKELVPQNMGKDEIDKLVIEELKHVGQITNQIKKLQAL